MTSSTPANQAPQYGNNLKTNQSTSAPEGLTAEPGAEPDPCISVHMSAPASTGTSCDPSVHHGDTESTAKTERTDDREPRYSQLGTCVPEQSPPADPPMPGQDAPATNDPSSWQGLPAHASALHTEPDLPDPATTRSNPPESAPPAVSSPLSSPCPPCLRGSTSSPAHHEIARLACSEEPRPRIRSERARRVARWFGIDRVIYPGKRTKGSSRHKTDPDRRERQRQRDEFLHDLADVCFQPNRVTLITGPSGAGKSSLLRQWRHEYADSIKWTDLAKLDLPNRPLVDCFGNRTKLPDILMQLSCVGLGEAWSYLKTPRELSEGQRWRLRLALGLHEASRGISDFGLRMADWKKPPDGPGPSTSQSDGGPDPSTKNDPDFNPRSEIRHPPSPAVLVCDEFAAVLDRVTACVVSRALRRNIEHLPGLCAVVATSHEDLVEALSPDVVVRCDFGRVVVERRG